MQIVIEIEDYDKEWITNGYYIPNEINEKIAEAIIKGISLPKDHGDLIDRKELLKQPMNIANYPSNYVEIAPAVIKAESEETK